MHDDELLALIKAAVDRELKELEQITEDMIIDADVLAEEWNAEKPHIDHKD